MLEFALHTPTRHMQAPLAAAGNLLFRPPGGDWAIKSLPDNELRADQIDLLPVGEGVRIKSTIELAGLTAGGKSVDWRSAGALSLPLRFVAGDTRIEVVDCEQRTAQQSRTLESLHSQSKGTGDSETLGPAPATLTRWFEALSTLNRWPASSEEFYCSVASLVVDPLGLDGAYVLRQVASEGGSAAWDIVAANLPQIGQGVWLDLALLDCLIESPETWFHPLSSVKDSSEQRPAYVVAPWLDSAGRVAGAIVGVRHVHKGDGVHAENGRRGVRHLEAKLVRLLACSVADIEARRQQEAESAQRRALLQRTFTPDLAEQIERDPTLLEGSGREVSLLFADLRDGSQLFHEKGETTPSPAQAFDLLSELLNALTEQVLQRAGVVIDYYGDGLAAMWNAPVDQPDHPERACDAAIGMIEAVDLIAQRWKERLGWSVKIGVGVHTGATLVGDIGSQWKIKYGARGAAVNLTNRVEQATKQLGLPLVITGAVQQRLSSRFVTQRLCRARLAGVEEETNLYSLRRSCEAPSSSFDEATYAEALALFEAGRFDPALRRLTLGVDDALTGPAAFLAERIRTARSERRGRRLNDRPAEAINAVIDLAVV